MSSDRERMSEKRSRQPQESTDLTEDTEITNSYLDHFLSRQLKIASFMGVFPCDILPKKIQPNTCVILNTDPHFQKGNHYVCINRNARGEYLYFDPLALDPQMFFPRMIRELKKRKIASKLYPVCHSPIQAPVSRFCGLFCADYVMTQTIPKMKKAKYFTRQDKLLQNDKICLQNIVSNIKKRK